ncbi:phage major capsid protein [uncultured Secundilactobacillus sp.]|uniref:phage major capsid protein n=1 Tax=uncultured Secundilactobacillus sp. TaxID=2813935 RepID=UPI00258383AE|nr:phage major capsid protein [uncultured Secundilactobacillus sp.]
MFIKNISDKIQDSQHKLQELSDQINAALVDENFKPDDMQALKDAHNKEQARYDELISFRDEVEADTVTKTIKQNSTTTKTNAKVLEPSTKELEHQALNDFLHTKGRVKDAASLQVTSTEAEPLIPEEIIYNPNSEVNTVQDLKQLVTTTAVSTASGKYPILQRATDAFPTVEELKENPALAEPNFKDVPWAVKTYRGAIPLSQEAIADTQIDLVSLVAKNMQEKSVNTTNAAIAPKLQSFTAVSATVDTLTDDLKGILNVKLDPAYKPTIVATSSMYNALDTLKDKNGQYIFHQDVTSASTGTLFGIQVVRVNDELLGKAGTMAAFVGDLARAILFADRQQVSLSWADDKIWGQYLMGALRFDVEVADEKAGYFVTVSAASGSTTPAK